jgi:hypothetical protein
MVKLLHILKKNQKKIKKIVAKKLNSKWPLNSRWLPKRNQIFPNEKSGRKTKL